MLLSGLMLLFAGLAAAQPSGATLSGQVVDARTGDPLMGASVLVVGTLLGTATDEGGRYVLEEVPADTVRVRVTMEGYRTADQRLVLQPGEARMLDVALQRTGREAQRARELPPPFATAPSEMFGIPRIAQPDYSLWPVRSVAGAAALQPGVNREEGGDDLALRALPLEQTAYYLNGLPLPEGLRLPWHSLDAVQVLSGYIPARYGGALSGLVVLETRAQPGEARRPLRLEGITSRYLDTYGYHLAAISGGRSFWQERFQVFAAGEYRVQDDADPRAYATPRLRDGMLDALRQHPQVLVAHNPATDEEQYIPFPKDLEEGATFEELRAAVDLPVGFELRRTEVAPAPETYTAEQFEDGAAKVNNRAEELEAMGVLAFAPTDRTRLQLSGSIYGRDGHLYNYTRALYVPERMAQTEQRVGRLAAGFSYDLTSTRRLGLQAAYSAGRSYVYDPAFSHDVEDTFFYGDISHPANAVLQRYWTVDQKNRYVRRFRDGQTDPARIYGLFEPPGAGGLDYEKHTWQQIDARGTLHLTRGRHQLEAGLEVMRRTQRRYVIQPAALAGYYDDADGSERTNQPVTRYSALPYEAFRDNAVWYGYNFLGTKAVNDQDVAAFVYGAGEDASRYDVAPFRPARYSGYVSDRWAFGPLTLDGGLRLDVFDHNFLGLYDLYAAQPVVRAGDLDVGLPAAINADDVPYFNNQGDVIGYRRRDEAVFFDATGEEVSFDLINSLGSPRIPRDEQGNSISGMDPSMFASYEARWKLQPRLAFNLRLPKQLHLFGYYNRVARQPWVWMDVPFTAYRTLNGGEMVGNPRLKPERGRHYGLGVRRSLGAGSALIVEGFHHRYRDLASWRYFREAYPVSYVTSVNGHRATVKGLEVAVETRRPRLMLQASYTLQAGTGTPVPDEAASVWTGPGEPQSHPLDEDRRHQFKAAVSYRFGEQDSPLLLSLHPLAHTSISLFADVKSGRPYTARAVPERLANPFTGDLDGGLNEERLPWTVLVNLRLERRFAAGAADLTAFLWIQNLLDADNTLRVYGATGEPDDDGWLDTNAGHAYAEDQFVSQAFRDQYHLRMRNPQHVGIPRLIRLGLQLDF